MKKIIITAAVLCSTLLAHSQAILNFCTFVNNQTQECVFDNTKFITSPDSTRARLFMMLRSAETFDTTQLTFKIYALDRFDKELYLTTVVEDVKPDWRTAWQPEYFTSPGRYNVKVYSCDTGYVITSKGFDFFNH